MRRVIQVRELTEESFAPHGRIFRPPLRQPAGRSGSGWKAWNGVAQLDCPQPLTFGSVQTDSRQVVVDVMERHVHTFELLYPHGAPLIQPVAPPRDIDNDDARPAAEDVVAFLLQPGDAIVMHPGTWHSPAFPAVEDCTYTFACMEASFPYVPEWIRLQGDAKVLVE